MRRFIGEKEAINTAKNSKKWKELKSRLDEINEKGDVVELETISEEMKRLIDNYLAEAEDHNDAIKSKD